ncbi:MAG: hypothetical protein KKE62_16195 [Proteobacteria bacterium]|nr:hypothetical protein [Pseudomonadota bacterium]MBU1386723.1 hypothetical protein [Pseudomonadota bacterium]MBU1544371.1 hypothetical protein [Pseudomonadota bacterium]MBU2481749.1 hypothetical protein [Pseudomonadota bacterium]
METSNKKAMFFGKVTASVTHEIQNVLAIIKETSGLMEDFILMHKTNQVPDFDSKLDKCLETLKKQAYRGVSLTSNLNGFAHTPDNIQSAIDICETTKKLISITDRLFKQKNVSVEVCECTASCSITTDPVIFQMILFSCIECMIDTFQIQQLMVNIHPKENTIGICFSIGDENFQYPDFKEKIMQSSHWSKITDLCEQINFTAGMTPGSPKIFILVG